VAGVLAWLNRHIKRSHCTHNLHAYDFSIKNDINSKLKKKWPPQFFTSLYPDGGSKSPPLEPKLWKCVSVPEPMPLKIGHLLFPVSWDTCPGNPGSSCEKSEQPIEKSTWRETRVPRPQPGQAPNWQPVPALQMFQWAIMKVGSPAPSRAGLADATFSPDKPSPRSSAHIANSETKTKKDFWYFKSQSSRVFYYPLTSYRNSL
jgi:hypothetical protein